ncbi:unnamed protein product, partial [Rotaria magnacalcarata]
MPFHERCGLCEVFIRNKRGFKLITFESLFDHINELYELLHSRSLAKDCTICNACYQKHLGRFKASTNSLSSSEGLLSNESMDVDVKVNNASQTDQKPLCERAVTCSLLVPDTVRLPVYVTPMTHRYCSICQKEFCRSPPMDIPDNVRFQALLKDMIYFRPGCRCCVKHVAEGQLLSNATQLVKMNCKTMDNISTNILTSMLDDIWSEWKRCSISLQTKPIPIDYNESLRYTDEDYWTLTGIHKEDFDSL